MTAKHPGQETPPGPSHDLSGKRVMVVGGKVGMGLGIARAARAAGAAVTVASRRSVSLEERPDLAPFEQLRLDVTDESAVRDAFESVGQLDHLLVTAAPDLGSWGGFMDADMRGVRSYMEGKFFGAWACARHAAPRLAQDGSITFLTGGTGVRPKLGFTAVMSAFAAVEALSRSLALELAPVRVNTIRPGFVDTEMWSFLSEEDRERVRAKVRDTFPARRVGTIDDIGHAALFLMTNPYVKGHRSRGLGGRVAGRRLLLRTRGPSTRRRDHDMDARPGSPRRRAVVLRTRWALCRDPEPRHGVRVRPLPRLTLRAVCSHFVLAPDSTT